MGPNVRNHCTSTGGARIGLVGLWLVLLAAGCSEPPPEAPKVVRPVKIFTIEGPGSASQREYPATVKAAQHADMGFEVPGKVTEFLVKEGQTVKTGEVLARLDDREQKAQVARTKAAVEQAESNLQKVKASVAKASATYNNNKPIWTAA